MTMTFDYDRAVLLEEQVDEMLLNAEAHVGGAVGIYALELESEALGLLRERGFTGPKGGLTRKGVQRSLLLQREAGWIW